MLEWRDLEAEGEERRRTDRREFEVDQNVVGRRWNVTLKRDGAVVFRGVRVTRAPSGSFSITRRIANPGGADRVVATAKTAAGGTCRAALTV